MRGLEKLVVIGLSHWNSPVSIREKFSLPDEKLTEIYSSAKELSERSLMVISTCNRVELVALTDKSDLLVDSLCKVVGNPVELFWKYAYHKTSREALNHIFRLTSGLDSQILGDFQIAGQVKKSFQKSLDLGHVDAVLSRIMQQAFNVGKKVRTDTSLSSGTSSVASAAVYYLQQNIPDLNNKSVLLLGAGKIGTVVLDNLSKLIEAEYITIINRTDKKARSLASKFNNKVQGFEDLRSELNNADIILVATDSSKPTVKKDMFEDVHAEKLVIDLSVPRNVELTLNGHNGIQVINIDDLGLIQDDAIQKRKESIPMAEKLVNEGITEFAIWLKRRNFLHSLREELYDSIFDNGLENVDSGKSKFINKLTNKYMSRVA